MEILMPRFAPLGPVRPLTPAEQQMLDDVAASWPTPDRHAGAYVIASINDAVSRAKADRDRREYWDRRRQMLDQAAAAE